MDIIFATQNPNKVIELQGQIPKEMKVKSLLDLKYTKELEETENTLEGNALQKARFVHQKFGKNCFADDTGLEVEALNGEPGVYSARYAGEEKSFDANMDKLLSELGNSKNRNAQFRTAIALIFKGREYVFEGICKGEITLERKGAKGFGYDPIFKPSNSDQTFAEMNLNEKAKISHRGLAFNQLIQFLNEQMNP